MSRSPAILACVKRSIACCSHVVGRPRAGLKGTNTKGRNTSRSRTRESDVPSTRACTARPRRTGRYILFLVNRIFKQMAASDVALKQLST